jgi:hypothetical protein
MSTGVILRQISQSRSELVTLGAYQDRTMLKN